MKLMHKNIELQLLELAFYRIQYLSSLANFPWLYDLATVTKMLSEFIF